jgi:hypothetical protein
MTLSKIFKYEEYDKSLTQIKKIYKKDFSFGHENKTSWSRDDFLKDYNKENIELVRELFSVDFMNFNYDMKGHDIF